MSPGATVVLVPPRFTLLQRTLHWSMAACILAMLFIGVGMVSTIRQRYLTLAQIHKPLGIAILLLVLVRIAMRLRFGAPPLPADLPEPMKLAAHLSHYAFYGLMLAMPLLGWGYAVCSSLSGTGAGHYPAADPAAERNPTQLALERAPHAGLRFLCPDPPTCRCGIVPRVDPARRSVRGNGAGAGSQRIEVRP